MRTTRRRRRARLHAPPASYRPSMRLTPRMVDRLLWRAGYGPSPADRRRYAGRRWSDVVDLLLRTPAGVLPGRAPTYGGARIDPVASDDELVLEWLDRMLRARNPLAERLTFFWARHWAISLDGGIPQDWALQYVGMLRRFGDLARAPRASFRDLAYAVSESRAMLRYLNGNQSVRSHPNENYGREFMELFCLGVTDAHGRPNYTEADVKELARAFTGWVIDRNDPAASVGRFTPSRYDPGTKTILGHRGGFGSRAAANVVLDSPRHAPFIVRKLWQEFIVTLPGDATIARLGAVYRAGGRLEIRPLLREILLHPHLFESLGEPNMIKPPVVYVIGVLRATGAPLADTWQTASLDAMGQLPYNPPNVAGWEGGLSWLSTTAAQARFDFAVRALHLARPVSDVRTENGDQAFARAYAACGAPWLAAGTRLTLLRLARSWPVHTRAQRLGRQYALRAFILGGPDGQVM